MEAAVLCKGTSNICITVRMTLLLLLAPETGRGRIARNERARLASVLWCANQAEPWHGAALWLNRCSAESAQSSERHVSRCPEACACHGPRKELEQREGCYRVWVSVKCVCPAWSSPPRVFPPSSCLPTHAGGVRRHGCFFRCIALLRSSAAAHRQASKPWYDAPARRYYSRCVALYAALPLSVFEWSVSAWACRLCKKDCVGAEKAAHVS